MNSSTGVVYLLTYLDSQTGGMERQALQLAEHLRSHGYDIFFITCARWSQMRKAKLKIVDTIRGFQVYRIPLTRGWRHFNAALYFFGAVVVLLLFRRRYTIIHAHQIHTSGVIACAVKFLLRSKKVIVKNCCGGEFGDVLNLRKLLQLPRLYAAVTQRADCAIAISDETERELRAAHFPHITPISNGVDTHRFVPSTFPKEVIKAKLLPEHSKKKCVLFVGKLDPQKNVHVLLETIPSLSEEVIVLIVGTGVLEQYLRSTVRDLGVEDRVVFYGTTSSIEQLYQSADVFVLPSRAEGSPNALLEAMSCQLACIGSDIPSIRAILVPEKNGYIYGKHDDVRALTNTLMRALSHHGEAARFGGEARTTIEDSYSIGAVARSYATLYASLHSLNVHS